MSIIYYMWRSVIRKRTRAVLMFLSIFITFLIFGLLSGVYDLFTGKISVSYGERLIVANKYSLALPYGYYSKLQSMENVIPEEVVHCSILYGYYQKPENSFRQMAVNAQSYMALEKNYVDLPNDQYQAWLRDRRGAIINKELADKYNWKIGDEIPILSSLITKKDGTELWTFTIRGIVTPKREGFFTWEMLFHHEYFEESQANHEGVSFFILNARNQNKARQLTKEIDRQFANSTYPTKTLIAYDLINQRSKQVGNFALIITLVMAGVFLTMLLVTGNSLSQALRERIPEIAILKTLGFSSSRLMAWTIYETAAFYSAAAFIGLICAYTIAKLQNEFPGLVVSNITLVQGIAISCITGMLVALPAAVLAKKMQIATALRRR